VYFNVKFNVIFKLIKLHLLVSELYIHLSCSLIRVQRVGRKTNMDFSSCETMLQSERKPQS